MSDSSSDASTQIFSEDTNEVIIAFLDQENADLKEELRKLHAKYEGLKFTNECLRRYITSKFPNTVFNGVIMSFF